MHTCPDYTVISLLEECKDNPVLLSQLAALLALTPLFLFSVYAATAHFGRAAVIRSAPSVHFVLRGSRTSIHKQGLPGLGDILAPQFFQGHWALRFILRPLFRSQTATRHTLFSFPAPFLFSFVFLSYSCKFLRNFESIPSICSLDYHELHLAMYPGSCNFSVRIFSLLIRRQDHV
jgi:hypothetical protein